MRRLALLVLTTLTVTLGYGCGKSPASPSGQNTTFTGTVSAEGFTSHTINVSKSGTMTVSIP